MDEFERRARARGFHAIAGIDEAGRGPLAGPVVAAAVILPEGYVQESARQRGLLINDSKKLSSRQRGRLFETISRDAVSIGIGVVEPAEIDEMNILRATLTAMKEAVSALASPPDYLLIDGINKISVETPQETIVSGDSRSISVAAASIVAKVSRDRLMELYHRQFPQYNFIRNKGYGTREHREAILRYGRSKIHRRSFRVAGLDGGDSKPANEKLPL